MRDAASEKLANSRASGAGGATGSCTSRLVRRALTALTGISKVAALDPVRAGRLRDLPVTVVNTIARWTEYDRWTAFEAMDRYEAGAIGTRQIDIEEWDARKRDADFFCQPQPL